MFTVGTDPNWQQDKLARLMQALELARARREQKRAEEEAKAGQRFKLILSAADRNPNALASPTVRDFVAKNAKLIPGLEEWYALENASRADPNGPEAPRSAYEKLLGGADRAATSAEVLGAAPGIGGAFARAAGATMRARPAVAFDAAAAGLAPSERLRAGQYAKQIGVEIPATDPEEVDKKVSGPLYVVQNPERFTPDAVRAARLQLQLDEPRENPDKKVTGALYVVEHPEQFNEEAQRAARYQLNLAQPPWEAKTPGDKLSGAFAVLNDPKSYSAEALRYARALVRQSERSASESGGGESKAEKGKLSESQAYGEIDDYLRDLLTRLNPPSADGTPSKNPLPLRPLSPAQRRQAAQLLRDGGDVDTFVVNSLFPADGRSLDRVVDRHVAQPGVKAWLEARGENSKLHRARVRAGALREIQRLTQQGMSAAAARAQVFMNLLDGER